MDVGVHNFIFSDMVGYGVNEKVSDWIRIARFPYPYKLQGSVAASGPTIWASTYLLEPVLCNRLLIEPSGWAQTVHMFTQRFT